MNINFPSNPCLDTNSMVGCRGVVVPSESANNPG